MNINSSGIYSKKRCIGWMSQRPNLTKFSQRGLIHLHRISFYVCLTLQLSTHRIQLTTLWETVWLTADSTWLSPCGHQSFHFYQVHILLGVHNWELKSHVHASWFGLGPWCMKRRSLSFPATISWPEMAPCAPLEKHMHTHQYIQHFPSGVRGEIYSPGPLQVRKRVQAERLRLLCTHCSFSLN